MRFPHSLFAPRRIEGLRPIPAFEFVVTGAFARFMVKRGWAGFTLPLPILPCVILYWMNVNPECRVHEFVHAQQRARFGFLGFVMRYLWGLRRGYRNHPLEMEAYATRGASLPAWARDFRG